MIIGLYVHTHWGYRHPYAARTWTFEDWRGFAGGLRELGYNAILIWPMIELMPDPLTASDRTYLDRLSSVIDMLRDDLGMRVYVHVAPNVMPNEHASTYSYEERRYFSCEELVDPGDPTAIERLLARREELLRPLAKVEGVVIIDSDPGGYPGSTIEEFVALLGGYRRVLDRLRSGIELIYWMCVGWRGWCRLHEEGQWTWATEEEHLETLTHLATLNPEPWGVAITQFPPDLPWMTRDRADARPVAERLGLGSRVLSFNYSWIEEEPSFPMTNFGGTAAYDAGRNGAARGVFGNAQTHCVQLPNIFAFARGACGLSLTDSDYVAFADDLVPGRGAMIHEAWSLLHGSNAEAMRTVAARLASLRYGEIASGRLAGLLFGDPHRFINDLSLMLEIRAARVAFIAAARDAQELPQPLRTLATAADTWQRQHGYKCLWQDAELHDALRKLESPALNAVLDMSLFADPPEPGDGASSPSKERVADRYRAMETHTTEIIRALKAAV